MADRRKRGEAPIENRRRGWPRGVLACIVVVPAMAQAQVLLDNVSAAAGVGTDFYKSLHIHSLGINWIDFNVDGWPDLFMVNGKDSSAHLFENDHAGGFIRRDDLLPALPNEEMMGSVFGDMDNDGDPDLYIFTDYHLLEGAYNRFDGPLNVLLKNLWVENGGTTIPGQPLFVDVAGAAGVADEAIPPFGPLPGYRSATGGLLDYDRDGNLDLYVGHWVWDFGGDPSNRDRLFRNNGGGTLTFSDVTSAAGLPRPAQTSKMRPTLAFIGAHLDEDFWPDLYVVNVQMPSPLHHDFYFRNRKDGTFFDATPLSPGVGDDSGAGMGVDVADIDLDGDWDLYMSDLLNVQNDSPPMGNPLYLNNGDGTFSDNSAPEAGVISGDSWAVNFFDVDQDCDEDLFVGRIGDLVQSNLYINDGTGHFVDDAAAAGLGLSGNVRGAATADFDRDGMMDLAVVHQRGYLVLYRNVSQNAGHWLQVSLTGERSNKSAIGTMLQAETSNPSCSKQLRQIKGGSSTHSQDELLAHFGLGTATTVDTLVVTWPSGEVNTFKNLAADQRLDLVERYVSTPGVFDPVTSRFSARQSLSNGGEQFGVDLGVGGEGWTPIAGDWDGDTVETPGVYDMATGEFLLWNDYDGGAPDVTVAVSPVPVGGLPIAGDWTGDGLDNVGVFEPGSKVFWLWNTLQGGAPDTTFPVTINGTTLLPLSGDWDGDGIDTVALFSQTSASFYLRNANERQGWDQQVQFSPGGQTYLPIGGDWDHDGTDTVGVYRPDNNRFYLKLSLADGPADIILRFQGAAASARPVVGAWDRLK